MKHCIIVKWKKDVNKNEILVPVKELFNRAKQLSGISDVLYIENCIDIPNRYDLMIQVVMNKEALDVWNNSEVHKTWKSNYGDLIESKAIFDYE